MKVFPLFATGINDTSGIGGKFAAGVIDTGGKFATGVVDTFVNTSGKFAADVVEDDSRKKLEAKYLVTLSL